MTPGLADRRHLLRLWLTAHDFAGVDDLLRGGIPVQQQDESDPSTNECDFWRPTV
jgi:hypothetical protein